MRSVRLSALFLVLALASLPVARAAGDDQVDNADARRVPPAADSPAQPAVVGAAAGGASEDFEDEGPLPEAAEPSAPAATEEPSQGPPPSAEQPEGEQPGMVMQALESSQKLLSDTVVRLSRRMDRMLGAREVYPEEAYDSVLRLRLIQHIEEGANELQADVSGRISLPGTEDRLGVIFTSEDYENPLDRERGTERELSATEPRVKSFALRLLQPIDQWQTALSAGLRTGAGTPIDAVVRARLWRIFEVDDWQIRPRQSIFWYGERGPGESTEVRFERPLGEKNLFRSETGATWFQRDDEFYYDQVFSLLQPLGPKDGLLWQVGAQGQSEPNTQLVNYYLQVRLRHVTYRDWLIFEITPQLLRESSENFRTEQKIFVGFEILFGGKGSY